MNSVLSPQILTMNERIGNHRPLVETKDLKKHFSPRRSLFGPRGEPVKAVDGVSLHIWPGEAVGLVGETGSGKSTFGRCLLRIYEPTAGQIIFEGTDITHLSHKEMGPLRTQMQMVFQNPYSSLNPRMRIKSIVAEPLRLHRKEFGPATDERVKELLSLVALDWDFAYRLPNELSGGQRQRVAIARALALNPKFLVLDEPTSALDVSVQAQALNLLVELQDSLGLAYLFISHNLGVIRYICDRVAIMYRGRIVETGRTQEIFGEAHHPYTQSLLSSILEADPDQKINEVGFSDEMDHAGSELVQISDTHWVTGYAAAGMPTRNVD